MVVNNSEKIVIMRSFATDPEDKEDITGGGAIAIPKTWVARIEYLKVDHADIRN